MQRRRQANRAETIALILDTARAVMREHGAAALNLNEVARRVGMRTPSLYEYFANKDAIYDALFRLGLQLFAERNTRDKQPGESTWEYLASKFEAYLAFAHEHPELYQLVFERPVPGFVPSEEAMAESRALLEASRQQLADLMRDAPIATGLPPHQSLDLLIAMMHGLTAQHMANEPHLPPGAGRFGSLLPSAVAIFEAAWSKPKKR